MEGAGWLWLVLDVLGAVVLAAALIYGNGDVAEEAEESRSG